MEFQQVPAAQNMLADEKMDVVDEIIPVTSRE